MIVRCTQCGAKYSFDESRFGDASSKRLRCTSCETIFTVERPQSSAQEPSLSGTETTTRNVDFKHVERQEEKELPDLVPLPRKRRYSLAVIDGPDAGSIFTMNSPRVVIGRGSECDVQLSDGEVSRRHAMVEVRGDVASLSDLGSTNGSFVDGVRVDVAPLAANQEFRVGVSGLMFIVTELDVDDSDEG